MKKLSLILYIATSFALQSVAPVSAVELVPPGNRNAVQPKVPGASARRTRGSSFNTKYKKIRNLLAKDRKLMGKIKKAASSFAIDPIHIIGALVGEHTYNVDAKDRLQSYYVKALAYLNQDLSFQYKGTSIDELVSQPAFSKCNGLKNSYSLWSCRERVWNVSYRGKSKEGQRWPNHRMGHVFFQPFYAGQTFGLGQLNPLTALKVNDLVRSRVRREPRLSTRRAPEIYNTIMEPDSTLIYMAAVIRNSIDSYKSIAGFDISKNPGVTATLYNLGNVQVRAYALKAKNKRLKSAGKKPQPPQENYYGWLVNEKEADLRSIL